MKTYCYLRGLFQASFFFALYRWVIERLQKNCVSLDVIIIEDNTNYGDPTVSNLFEKFKVHCIQDTSEANVNKYTPRDVIRFKNIGKCSVWGDYSSQLSVEAVVEVVGK